ncbi:MAG: 23S rRNA (pseudouridine(1915)-N(3))-methyltransferase RlmH [Candidatus Gracilibacteria bacterium]|nr:23S rRNA (pseudouridine(1915)-N(3))-methyltransferase RlmH [Candidatus Gracilibacteria bacterium]
MIKIIIFSDSFKHFEESIKEYEKRLVKDIEVIKLKPSKRKEISEIILEETKDLKEKLEKTKGFKILLYISGEQLSTERFLELIEKQSQNFGNIVFIIGGAYGVELEMIKNLIDFKLSFSNMIFPHNMAYLILLEQIYRIITIKKGSSYHH